MSLRQVLLLLEARLDVRCADDPDARRWALYPAEGDKMLCVSRLMESQWAFLRRIGLLEHARRLYEDSFRSPRSKQQQQQQQQNNTTPKPMTPIRQPARSRRPAATPAPEVIPAPVAPARSRRAAPAPAPVPEPAPATIAQPVRSLGRVKPGKDTGRWPATGNVTVTTMRTDYEGSSCGACVSATFHNLAEVEEFVRRDMPEAIYGERMVLLVTANPRAGGKVSIHFDSQDQCHLACTLRAAAQRAAKLP